jgi:hypothetical protein
MCADSSVHAHVWDRIGLHGKDAFNPRILNCLQAARRDNYLPRFLPPPPVISLWALGWRRVEPDNKTEHESRSNPGGKICTCYWEGIYSCLIAGILPLLELEAGDLRSSNRSQIRVIGSVREPQQAGLPAQEVWLFSYRLTLMVETQAFCQILMRDALSQSMGVDPESTRSPYSLDISEKECMK